MLLIFFAFFTGFILKRKNLAIKILKINFYFLLPIFIFYVFSKILIEKKDMFLPGIAGVIIVSTFAISFFIFKKEPPNDKGIYIISPMIMNISAIYPIIFLNFHESLIKYVALFDIGNGILTLTFTYFIAIYYGSKGEKFKLRKIFSPPLIALILGVIVNHFQLNEFPKIFYKIIEIIKIVIAISIYFSLGSLLEIQKINKKIFYPIIIRILFGGLIGGALAKIFNYPFKIILLCSMAPCGFNTLTFAVIAELNVSLASNIVSLSLIIFILIAIIILNFL